MNWVQFKDPHCYLCLHGTVEACWFITQDLGGSNTPFCKNNFYRFCRFFGVNLGKTPIPSFDILPLTHGHFLLVRSVTLVFRVKMSGMYLCTVYI